jgi:hypothetical protein
MGDNHFRIFWKVVCATFDGGLHRGLGPRWRKAWRKDWARGLRVNAYADLRWRAF